MQIATLQPIEFKGSYRFLIFAGLLFQLLLMISFFWGPLWTVVGLLVILFPIFLSLPLTFWMCIFISSIFIFFNPWHHYQFVEFMAVILIGVFAGWHFCSSDMKLKASPLFFPILLFLFTIGLSLLDVHDFRIGLIRYAHYILIFLTYWILHNILFLFNRTRESLNWYIFMSVFGCITMIWQILLLGTQRTFGIAGIPFNDILLSANIIAFSFFLFSEKSRSIWLIIYLFLLFSLILTQTRGIWLGFLLITLFLFVFLHKNERVIFSKLIREKVLPILIIVTLLFMLVVIIYPNVQSLLEERLSQITSPQSEKKLTSIFTRALIWDTAINVFKHHPINGIGIDLFPFISQNYCTYNPLLYDLLIKGLDPHLLVLTFLSETGIIGTIGFIVLLISAFTIALKNYKLSVSHKEKAVSLSLVGVMFQVIVTSFYAGSWFYGQNSYQFMFFLAATTAFYQRKQLENAKD